MDKKNTRLRFIYEDDVALLKEFININPTINPQEWETIQQHLFITSGKNFQIRTIKQHIMLLLETWLKKVQVDEIRSGVEEPQCERNTLLQEVHAMCQENNYCFKEKKRPLSKEQQICELGKKAREKCASANSDNTELNRTDSTVASEDASLSLHDILNDHAYVAEDILSANEVVIHHNYEEKENIVPCTSAPSTSTWPSTSAHTNTTSQTNDIGNKNSNKVLGPSRKRINRREPLRRNALAYLTDKNEKENQIRIMELELEQRKVAVAERQAAVEERRAQMEEKRLQLDEKRLDLEYKERMARLEIEKNKAELELEQKKITNQLLILQQQQIDDLRRESEKS